MKPTLAGEGPGKTAGFLEGRLEPTAEKEGPEVKKQEEKDHE